MSNKYLDILTRIVRHPRHPVQESGTIAITIQRAKPMSEAVAAPEVIDLSRGGCRLRWSERLQKSEPITFCFADTANGLTLELPATVRWCRECNGDQFESGCQFDQEIDYEQLGELFLAGFLSTEEVAAE